jgi:methylenetetrahydrofolate dehydrogenase (NADP+)/methenyltetrahydrofolate cyclohydrolase
MGVVKMTAEIVYGKEIAGVIKKKVVEDVKLFIEKSGVKLVICTLMVGDDKPSLLYMNLRKKACDSVGIDTEEIKLSSSTSEKKILEMIQMKNKNQAIHGILVQLPLPPHISTSLVFDIINPKKDVEGLTPYNLGKNMRGEEYLVPCTPQAVLYILDYLNYKIQGKHVVIVNHSTIVGKPLSILCLHRNATVSVCHVFTEDLTSFTKKADVLVTAAGVPGLITDKHLKSDAIVIDVSIVKTKEGVRGDVNAKAVLNACSYLTPVPGGVGPVTIACALENMVKTMNLSLNEF